MRSLVFDVKDQIIVKNNNCNFDNIVSGTEGYLVAEFNFSRIWDGYGKVAVFNNLFEEEAVIIKNNKCLIPSKVLTGDKFYVKVIGSKKGQRLTTNEVTVNQRRDR